MKKYNRRKFVEKTVMSAAGITMLSTNKVSGKSNSNLNKISIKEGKFSGIQEINSGNHLSKNSFDTEAKTMRPVRKLHKISVTVGQSEGDIRGNDNIAIQAAIDYVSYLGGGTVNILPGVYILRNSIFPKAGVTIIGSGENTILRKGPYVSTKIIRESDWYEYAIQVENPEGFSGGCGLSLSIDKRISGKKLLFFTVTEIKGNTLYLDKLIERDMWIEDNARASTAFSLIYGSEVNDVCIENLVLDGRREENEFLNGNYAAGVFLISCNRWNFKNVIEHDFNGDGFSFQICDDIYFEDCSSLNNTTLGFHPGSGSQRPVFKRCRSNGNTQGFFWCWGVCDGIAEDCIASGNSRYGVNFGHRDTDNILRNCLIEKNGEIGILFRKEPYEYRSGNRNLIENCIIRDNGKDEKGMGIDIQWKTRDITIRGCQLENTVNGNQTTGIRISAEAQAISLENNSFKGCKINVDDKRKK